MTNGHDMDPHPVGWGEVRQAGKGGPRDQEPGRCYYLVPVTDQDW
jgi:hypothetical protein